MRKINFILAIVLIFAILFAIIFVLILEQKILKDKQFIAEGCFVGGCAGEICSDEPVGQRYCFWYDPKWDCYKTARCEKQADGKCGWTITQELKECLEKAEKELEKT